MSPTQALGHSDHGSGDHRRSDTSSDNHNGPVIRVEQQPNPEEPVYRPVRYRNWRLSSRPLPWIASGGLPHATIFAEIDSA
jgi:hypothetical protein